MTLLYARPPFGALKAGAYDLLMVDPPWPTQMRSPKGERKSSGHHYGLMSFEAIAALPVGDLAARDAVLFLWCTWPMILFGGDPARKYADHDASRSRVGECIRSWGFRYATGGAWHKKTKNGKSRFGTGYRARSSCEPFLLCIRGNPLNSRGERNLIEGLAREHSRKPEEAYAWCERYMPGARRIKVFSRTPRRGWTTWGHERGKFEPVVSADADEGAGEQVAA
jgi:N6-adenosine-specific RNA methylase IME4